MKNFEYTYNMLEKADSQEKVYKFVRSTQFRESCSHAALMALMDSVSDANTSVDSLTRGVLNESGVISGKGLAALQNALGAIVARLQDYCVAAVPAVPDAPDAPDAPAAPQTPAAEQTVNGTLIEALRVEIKNASQMVFHTAESLSRTVGWATKDPKYLTSPTDLVDSMKRLARNSATMSAVASGFHHRLSTFWVQFAAAEMPVEKIRAAARADAALEGALALEAAAREATVLARAAAWEAHADKKEAIATILAAVVAAGGAPVPNPW